MVIKKKREREFIQIAISPKRYADARVSCRLRYDWSRLSLVINVTACSVNSASSWFVEGESKLPVITATKRERESLFEEKAGENYFVERCIDTLDLGGG